MIDAKLLKTESKNHQEKLRINIDRLKYRKETQEVTGEREIQTERGRQTDRQTERECEYSRRPARHAAAHVTPNHH